MTPEAPKPIAEQLAAVTNIELSTVKATGWDEQRMTDAFNSVANAKWKRNAMYNLSYFTFSLALVSLGLMLASPRFVLFTALTGGATYILRSLGRDAETRGVEKVSREIERAALANLSGGPKP